MTNGEVLQKTFPNSESDIDALLTKVVFTLEPRTSGQQLFVFDKDWWVAEYKEPITENCIACKYDETEEEDGVHCKKCLEGDSQFELDNEFVETITKNDLEVDCISRQEAIDTIRQLYLDLASQKAVIDLLKVLPSVTPQEPRWIPVTEDTPPIGTICLWCNKYGSVLHGCFSNGLKNYGDIVAWMPLPLPWKGE